VVSIIILVLEVSLILSFLIRSLLDLPADLLQKYISVVKSMFSDLFFSGHISLLYVTMLFMMVLYIFFLLSFEMRWSHNTLFNTEIAFLPCVHLSLMVLSIVPSLVMLISRYLHSSHRLIICPVFSVRSCCRTNKRVQICTFNERATDKAHIRQIVRKANKVVGCVWGNSREKVGEVISGGE
jgi:hypothetical protein